MPCCADSASLPLRAQRSDGLCSIRAFEYFPDKEKSVREFARLIKPGGLLLLVTKNRGYKGYGIKKIDNESSAPSPETIHSGNVLACELVDLLKRNGFEDIRIKPAIIGRTRLIFLWKTIRYLRRLVDISWRDSIPAPFSGLVESFMITAYKTSA